MGFPPRTFWQSFGRREQAAEDLPTARAPDLLRALNPAKPLITWMESSGANAPWLFLALFAGRIVPAEDQLSTRGLCALRSRSAR